MYCVPIHANIKCVVINVIYIVELQYRVLATWGPSSISRVAEFVFMMILLLFRCLHFAKLSLSPSSKWAEAVYITSFSARLIFRNSTLHFTDLT